MHGHCAGAEKMSIPQASMEANVIRSSVSGRKVRFLLEEAVLQEACTPLPGWLVFQSLGKGWDREIS